MHSFSLKYLARSYFKVKILGNIFLYQSAVLTQESPVVMFCSAPIAASQLVVLMSVFWITFLYSVNTFGCHSHSAPLG